MLTGTELKSKQMGYSSIIICLAKLSFSLEGTVIYTFIKKFNVYGNFFILQTKKKDIILLYKFLYFFFLFSNLEFCILFALFKNIQKIFLKKIRF